MEHKKVHTNSMEGPSKQMVNDALSIAAGRSGVELKIINEVKSFFHYTAYFSVTGYADQIQNFGNTLTKIKDEHNHYIDSSHERELKSKRTAILVGLKNYEVDSIETYQNCETQFEINMKTHRFSSVGDLGRSLKKALQLDLNVHETSNLLKKEVRFTARGTTTQFIKFKEIFLQHVKSNKVDENDYLDIFSSPNKKQFKY